MAEKPHQLSLKLLRIVTRGATGTRRIAAHYACMGKPRIIVTCPVTQIAVVTTFAYADMVESQKAPKFFRCPCGETHKLRYIGRHANLRRYLTGDDDQQAS
ncbi:MAG: hypothetical protein ACK4UO_04670 [Pseudolabrys sp.]